MTAHDRFAVEQPGHLKHQRISRLIIIPHRNAAIRIFIASTKLAELIRCVWLKSILAPRIFLSRATCETESFRMKFFNF